jgi:hypothetical protein
MTKRFNKVRILPMQQPPLKDLSVSSSRPCAMRVNGARESIRGIITLIVKRG